MKCSLKHFRPHSMFSFQNFFFRQSLAVTLSWRPIHSTIWDPSHRKEIKFASKPNMFLCKKKKKTWTIGELTGALSSCTKIVKLTQAHHHFHQTRMPAHLLLGGSLPSFLPDVLPCALTSSTPYPGFPSPLHLVAKKGRWFRFFSPQGMNFYPVMAQAQQSFLLRMVNNHAVRSKEQKENLGANGKRSYLGIRGLAHKGRLILGNKREGVSQDFLRPTPSILQPNTFLILSYHEAMQFPSLNWKTDRDGYKAADRRNTYNSSRERSGRERPLKEIFNDKAIVVNLNLLEFPNYC